VTDRYLDAKALAFEALTLSVDAREAFLAHRCGDDTALREEARWLIHAAETLTSEHLLTGWQPTIPDDTTPTLTAGEQISAASPGRYRVIRQIGEGGMGVVYLAQREEGDAHQQVALKFLGAATLGSAQHARRFAAEHRILATLRHPNIAHLLEGGTTADGRPFIAMEYVDGLRIDQWCALHAPSLPQRLALFLKVCAAVEHAHQHLVIHRDLKPANILVNADGEPKLLDFGIARLLDDTVQGEATRTQVLTPAYASPEQVEGAPLTTAADVWALGVVLYELLAGQRPHQALDGHRLGEAILSGAIEPPSRRARRGVAGAGSAQDATPRLPPVRIPADVDAIVLKALRRDPQARYASVAAMAEDIRRFLQHRPVLARRGHALYRLGRLVRRQRWVIAAGVGVIAVAAGFAVQRERQLEEVLAERNKAQAVSEFMRDLFASARPDAGRDGEQITVREVLDKGAADLDRRENLDAGTRTALRLAIADAYGSLRLEHQSLPLLETSLAELQHSDDAVLRAQIMSGIANAHASAGRNAQALDALRQGMSMVEDDDAAFATWASLRRSELSNLSISVQTSPETIIEGFQDLLQRLSSHQALKPSPELGELMAISWSGMAEAYERARRVDDAIDAVRKAMELAERWNAPAPTRLTYAERHALLVLGKDAAEGVRLLKAVDRDQVRLIGPTTGNRAILLNQISVGLERMERPEESLEWSAQAVQVARDALGTDNRIYLQLAVNHAVGLNDVERRQEALAAVEAALPGLRALQAPGRDTVNLAYALSLHARILHETGGSLDTALDELLEANRLMEPLAAEFLVVQNGITRNLVRLRLARGERTLARFHVDAFVSLLDATAVPDDAQWRKNALQFEQLIAER